MEQLRALCGMALCLVMAACGDGLGGGGDDEASDSVTADGKPAPSLPDVHKVQFVARVDHPYFPLFPGARWIYEARTKTGVERQEAEVLRESHMVEGVAATVLHTIEYVDGAIIEESSDWFAQDDRGNVWGLGEDTCDFEHGQCANRSGSWQWGEKGALAGIVLPAEPTVDGQPFFHEFLSGYAQDVGEITALGKTVTVPAGVFSDCIEMRDTSQLRPTELEMKSFCRDVGLALKVEGGIKVQLVELMRP